MTGGTCRTGQGREAMGADLKREVGTVVKEEEGDQELGSQGSLAHIGVAPRTEVHKVVPSRAL